jgi:excinuclease UvrABC nuclease subunit
MLGERMSEIPHGEPGVYCMFDLDGIPAYAGRSGNLRSRLRQHFIRQDSSVVSYGRLDLWDISRIDWWLTTEDEDAEKLLLDQYDPYLNFSNSVSLAGIDIDFDPKTPDDSVYLLSEEEWEFRAQPYDRTKQKLEHLLRMVDKIKLAGHSNDTKRTLYEHERILRENIAEFLGVERGNLQHDLSDWEEE